MTHSARTRVSATHGSHPLACIVPMWAVRLLMIAGGAGLLLTPADSRQLTAIRVAPGGDLQAALDRARPGETILLTPGAEYVGSFILPPRPDDGSATITIRTDGTALPGPGVRTSPKYSGRLAIIRSNGVAPALRTAPGTHHWRIENVEFRANLNGEGEIVALGSGGRDQNDRAKVPHDLVLDRVYIHGDERIGQRRGVGLNSAATTIVNSHVSGIRAVGVEAQALCGWNGPGPFLIENNFLEAAGEVVMFGGADPWVDQLVPSDITLRGNHFTRPVEWREPLLATVRDVRATPTPSGSLRRGSYTYSVVAERPAAGDVAVSAPSDRVAISSNGGGVSLEWSPVSGAAAYRVYRSGDGLDVYWQAAAPRFVDEGTAGTAGTPAKRASRWTVKNLLELKNARRVVVDGNLFEHHWPQAQSGYAILLTPRNQSGRAPWSQVADVRFINNIVRRVSAGINISGRDDERPGEQTRDVVIENNLFADVGGEWGSPGDFVLIGNGPANVRIARNTVLQTGRALIVYGSRHGREVAGFVFTANVVRHNRYGLFGEGAGTGKAAVAKFFPGGVVEGNIFAGGAASEYPAGNRFEPAGALDDQLVEESERYRLKTPHRFGGAGADLTVLRTSGRAAPETPRRNTD